MSLNKSQVEDAALMMPQATLIPASSHAEKEKREAGCDSTWVRLLSLGPGHPVSKPRLLPLVILKNRKQTQIKANMFLIGNELTEVRVPRNRRAVGSP